MKSIPGKTLGEHLSEVADRKLQSVIDTTVQNVGWIGARDRCFALTHAAFVQQPRHLKALEAKARERHGGDARTTVVDGKAYLLFGSAVAGQRAATVTHDSVVMPMAFAVMRNYHEAMKTGIAEMSKLIEAGNIAGFRKEFLDYLRALAVHMRLEDDGMFALLDSVSDGAIAKAHIPEEHEHDKSLWEAVINASDSGVADAFKVWKEDHLAHLKHEEDVMMPITQKTGDTPVARAKVFATRVLATRGDEHEFEFFLQWGVSRLARAGSAQQAPRVATRVFCWGLQQAATAEEWNRWLPVIKQSCPPAIFDDMCVNFGLDGPGKQ